MNKLEKERIVARGRMDGFDFSGQSTRTLGIIERIYDEIDRRLDARKGCAINVKCICDAIGVNRPNVASNPDLRAIIERYKTAIPDDTAVQRRIAKLEDELETLKLWHRNSLHADLELSQARELIRQLQDKNMQLESQKSIYQKDLLIARAERDSLKKQVDELSQQVVQSVFGNIGR